MVRFLDGDLVDADADALVNAVNTVGTMGKGIALAFKAAHPDDVRTYAAACKAGEVEVGRMFVTELRDVAHGQRRDGPRRIVDSPTEPHRRDPSRMEWIEAGLADLRAFLEREGVRSIALPALGSANGGLERALVQPAIEAALSSLEGVDAMVYRPPAPRPFR